MEDKKIMVAINENGNNEIESVSIVKRVSENEYNDLLNKQNLCEKQRNEFFATLVNEINELKKWNVKLSQEIKVLKGED